ncbi:MAG: glycosyltransferase [Thermomicrobiales bacterium]|nr:glycosyltransferase [Thermomicrobiales bacterium]
MNETPTFTVFTPTYNRAHVLPRVYDSLRGQTFRDFEWLVVDDGSTDGTVEMVEGWIAAGELPLRFVRQDHGGFPVAFNRGVHEARGRFFLELDSDDACVPTALERFHQFWESIPEDRRDRFCGVTVLCMDDDGAIIGNRFPAAVIDSDYLEMRFRYKITGEKWGFQRHDVLRRHPFPQEDLNWGLLGTIWSAISREGYLTRYVDEPMRYYEVASPDSMSIDRAEIVAPSRQRYHRAVLNNDLHWFRQAPLQMLKSGVLYTRYSFHRHIGVVGQARRLDSAAARILWAVSLPAGYAMFRRDRR